MLLVPQIHPPDPSPPPKVSALSCVGKERKRKEKRSCDICSSFLHSLLRLLTPVSAAGWKQPLMMMNVYLFIYQSLYLSIHPSIYYPTRRSAAFTLESAPFSLIWPPHPLPPTKNRLSRGCWDIIKRGRYNNFIVHVFSSSSVSLHHRHLFNFCIFPFPSLRLLAKFITPGKLHKENV